jgi:hypothetical protein
VPPYGQHVPASRDRRSRGRGVRGDAAPDLPVALTLLARGDFRSGWGIPAILIFIWILCSGAFTVEANIARRRLAALLDASDASR